MIRKMIKSSLIKKLLKNNPHLVQKDVENIVSIVIDDKNGRTKILDNTHDTEDIETKKQQSMKNQRLPDMQSLS